KAGASDQVLAALRQTGGLKPLPPTTKKRTMMVFAKRYFESTENPLQSELTINGAKVGVFRNGDGDEKYLDKYLKEGWNTISLKTTPQYAASGNNSLLFTMGPVYKDATDKLVMEHVYWSFWNSENWSSDKGKFTHQLSRDAKDVTLSFRVYYAGPEFDDLKV